MFLFAKCRFENCDKQGEHGDISIVLVVIEQNLC